MWQLFVLGSLLAYAFEGVIDKLALVEDRRIDSLVATFWRVICFSLATFCLGLTGWLGHVQGLFPPILLPLVLMAVVSSLSYTYVLRRLEVTGIGAIGYLAPFAFLFIDVQGLQLHFSLAQIAGITLLVLGGIGFIVDGTTHRIKKEFSLLVWGALLFQSIFSGIEAYVFKSLHVTQGITGVTFFLDIWMAGGLVLLLIIIMRGKFRLLLTTPAGVYVPPIMLSKVFDALGTALWTQALVLAAVSQVAAMESLEPIVLFGVAFVAQIFFGYRVRERFSRTHLHFKLVAVCLLVLGGFLVG